MILVDIKKLHKGVTTLEDTKEFETIELADKFLADFAIDTFYSENPDGGTYAELRK